MYKEEDEGKGRRGRGRKHALLASVKKGNRDGCSTFSLVFCTSLPSLRTGALYNSSVLPQS